MEEIGRLLGGRYRLVELLGQGGMATIYRGQDTELGRDVAVKLLRPQFGRDPDFLARFRAEAQAVASLNDPNVVSVYDIGEDPAGPFIVMEFVEGEDLATLLRRNGPLPPRRAARIGAEVARALEAAHRQGIVHRDVKPANILIASDGRVKVTDFGIARALNDAQLTLPGTTMGSVHYLSPEQVRGLGATPASDVFALGIVLYELLTGRRPWEGETAASVAVARLHGAIPGPSDLVAVPDALDEVVRHALARDAADRYASASAMGRALESFLASTAAGPVGPGAASSAAPTGILERPGRVVAEEEVVERGTSPWTWVAGLAGLLVLLAAAFLVYRVVAGLGTTPAGAVPAPNLVGRTLEDARTVADSLGLLLLSEPEESEAQAPGTVLSQDPPPDTQLERGATITVKVATAKETVAVPDVRGRLEAEAVTAFFDAGLTNGTRTEAYDAVVPAGRIVSQLPDGGTQAPKGTPVAYVVSLGPEPSPSVSPSPSPSPSPTPTPVPTPVPTATPTPTPAPLVVGDWRCLTLAEATAELTAAGFVLGTVVTNPVGGTYDGTWLVQAQLPSPGELRPRGSAIRFTVIAPGSACP